jgi:ATP-dependent DNA ligase
MSRSIYWRPVALIFGRLPLRERKARLARVGAGAKSWIALTNGVAGQGRALHRAVVEADLEGIVAKHLADAYRPNVTRWQKVLNRDYTQRRGRAGSGFARIECRSETDNQSVLKKPPQAVLNKARHG